jgi:hypothetical protein
MQMHRLKKRAQTDETRALICVQKQQSLLPRHGLDFHFHFSV